MLMILRVTGYELAAIFSPQKNVTSEQPMLTSQLIQHPIITIAHPQHCHEWLLEIFLSVQHG